MKLAGVLWPRFMDSDVARFSWGEWSPSWGLALKLSHWNGDDHDWSLNIKLIYGSLFVYMPSWFFPNYKNRDDSGFGDSYGFSWSWNDGRLFALGSDIHLNWAGKSKILHLPWDPTWVRTSTLLRDGTWDHETKKNRMNGLPLGARPMDAWAARRDWLESKRWCEVYPYAYTLKSGEVQHRAATVHIEEREWRWRWLTWCPLFPHVQRTISVDFSDEVGERTGSWKGGTTGCGYELRHDETPLESLRRMESERKF